MGHNTFGDSSPPQNKETQIVLPLALKECVCTPIYANSPPADPGQDKSQAATHRFPPLVSGLRGKHTAADVTATTAWLLQKLKQTRQLFILFVDEKETPFNGDDVFIQMEKKHWKWLDSASDFFHHRSFPIPANSSPMCFLCSFAF